MSDPSLHFINPGACLDGDVFSRCALENSECHHTNYMSAYDLASASDLPEASSCTVDDITVGRCTHNHRCASDREICESGHQFRLNNTCTVRADLVSHEFTDYGRCRSNKPAGINGGETDPCVWRKTDCVEGTTWKEDRWCDCSKVRTGACLRGGTIEDNQFYCAVSEAACANGDQFVTFKDLEQHSIECRLCQEKDIELPDLGKPAIPGLESSGLNGRLTAGIVLCTFGIIGFLGAHYYRKQQLANKPQPVPTSSSATPSTIRGTDGELL